MVAGFQKATNQNLATVDATMVSERQWFLSFKNWTCVWCTICHGTLEVLFWKKIIFTKLTEF